MAAQLTFIVEKPSGQSEHVLEGTAFSTGSGVVGRGPEATLQLLDPTVSRSHVRLSLTEAQAAIECLSDNGTFVNGEPLERGQQVPLEGDPAWLQLGAVLFRIYRTDATNRSFAPISTKQLAASFDHEPLISLTVDGDACWVSCRGRYLDIQVSAARALLALCREPTRIVHDWDIQDAVGGPCNVPKLISRIRGAFRVALENEWVRPAELAELVRSCGGGVGWNSLQTADSATLLRRLVASRRGHGYALLLPADQVRIEMKG